jgi:ABC-type dipeptide/oligopeptide/nickel transport system permease component
MGVALDYLDVWPVLANLVADLLYSALDPRIRVVGKK